MNALAGSILDTPSNKNFLSALNFAFILKRAPHTEFFIQKINLLGLKLESPKVGTPFVNMQVPGEHLTYEPLAISFKVDEDLKNYLEIHDWMRGLGKPTTFKEYADLEAQPKQIGGIKSDISVIVMSDIKNPNYEITYIDAFPIYISQLKFDTTKADAEYLSVDAAFKYDYYDIARIGP
jgi:hypothetical protein